MKKVFIYVEGPTEEQFSKRILAPHLANHAILAIPIIATTKSVKSGGAFKGGLPTYHKARKEICRLLSDTSARAVSTMLDYYGLPRNFPGRDNPEGNTCFERVKFIEQSLRKDISDEKFIPFSTLHEFEGLLFSSPADMAAGLPGGQSLESTFQGIRQQFGTPEEINDQPSTAPHQRILNLYPTYQKPTFGVAIALRMGLQKIREQCPHFSSWLTTLEQL